MAKKKQHKGGGQWIQETRTDDTVEQEEGTFAEDSPAEEIALELKQKAPDFQAAMGKITYYLNRAGKRLSESRKKELERVKPLLREMYNRKDREKANSKRKASDHKFAAQWATWIDSDQKQHYGDQYLELLLAEPGLARSVHPEVQWEQLKKYKQWLLDQFEKEVPYPDPESKEEETEDFEIIKKKLVEKLNRGVEVPMFEIDNKTGKPLGPVLVPKVACIQSIVNGKREMTFASEVEALQFLADISKEKIIVAKELEAKRNTKTFKCPECGSKVLEQTKYCVKCKKKVKQASEELIFASADEAVQYLANLTGKKVQIAQ